MINLRRLFWIYFYTNCMKDDNSLLYWICQIKPKRFKKYIELNKLCMSIILPRLFIASVNINVKAFSLSLIDFQSLCLWCRNWIWVEVYQKFHLFMMLLWCRQFIYFFYLVCQRWWTTRANQVLFVSVWLYEKH